MNPVDREYVVHQPPPETEAEKEERIAFRASWDPHGRGKAAPGQPTAQAEAISITREQAMKISEHYGVDWIKIQEEMQDLVTRAVIAEAAAAGSLKELSEAQETLADVKKQALDTKNQLTDAKSQLTDANKELSDLRPRVVGLEEALKKAQAKPIPVPPPSAPPSALSAKENS